MNVVAKLADRTAVLFLGVAAGAAMGYAFGGGKTPPAMPPAPPPIAPPSKTAEAKPAAPARDIELTMPISRQLIDAVTEGRKVRIGVFGDSFGDGVWSALYRLLPRSRNYEVVKYSRQSTGFTRYASLNLEEHTAEQLAEGPIDIAVINYGANDTQGVFANGHFSALLSPGWKEVIGKRIEGMVSLLRSRGAMVYWVGLPRMRKPEFDADIRGMDAFYQAKMQELGVPFMEIAPLTVDESGAYNAYLNDGPDDKRTLIRANDGIHMSMTGYVRITRSLAARIDRYVDAARKQAGVTQPDAASAPVERPAA